MKQGMAMNQYHYCIIVLDTNVKIQRYRLRNFANRFITFIHNTAHYNWAVQTNIVKLQLEHLLMRERQILDKTANSINLKHNFHRNDSYWEILQFDSGQSKDPFLKMQKGICVWENSSAVWMWEDRGRLKPQGLWHSVRMRLGFCPAEPKNWKWPTGVGNS